MGKEDFTEIAVLVDPTEKIIVAPITRRTNSNGDTGYSFALLREFKSMERGDGRTPWFNKRHISALRRLLDQVERRIDAEIERLRHS